MNDEERQRLIEGENWFWRFALPKVNLFVGFVVLFMLVMGTWSLVRGAWVEAGLCYGLAVLNVVVAEIRIRNQKSYQRQLAQARAWLERSYPS